MHFGVSDFVSNVDINATKELLKEDYDAWKKYLKEKKVIFPKGDGRVGGNNEVYAFAKEVLRTDESALQKKLRNAKNSLSKADSGYKWKKRQLKIMDVFKNKAAMGSTNWKSTITNTTV